MNTALFGFDLFALIEDGSYIERRLFIQFCCCSIFVTEKTDLEKKALLYRTDGFKENRLLYRETVFHPPLRSICVLNIFVPGLSGPCLSGKVP